MTLYTVVFDMISDGFNVYVTDNYEDAVEKAKTADTRDHAPVFDANIAMIYKSELGVDNARQIAYFKPERISDESTMYEYEYILNEFGKEYEEI